MSTPPPQQQRDDIKTASRKTIAQPRRSMLGELLGMILYLVAWHQVLHLIAFATNVSTTPPSFFPLSSIIPVQARMKLNSFLATIFPGSIDFERSPTVFTTRDSAGPLPSFPETSGHEALWPLMTNAVLFLPIVLQHSLMARSAFKNKLHSFLPRWAERVTYTFLSALAFQTMFYFWRPMPTPVWNLAAGGWLEYPLALALQALWTGGVLWTLAAMYASMRVDTFGHREAFSGCPVPSIPERTPFLFRLCRHPVFFGTLLCLWATPTMTQGRMFLAAAVTLYTVIAVKWQEADLVNRFGRKYADYKQQVPCIVPSFTAET